MENKRALVWYNFPLINRFIQSMMKTFLPALNFITEKSGSHLSIAAFAAAKFLRGWVVNGSNKEGRRNLRAVIVSEFQFGQFDMRRASLSQRHLKNSHQLSG